MTWNDATLFLQNKVAVEKRVAVAIWRLSTGNSFRTVSKVFGVGLSTSSEICMEFCRIMSKLAHNFIKFSQNGQETAIAIRRFQAFTNSIIPNIVGIIDGIHFEITCPDTESRVDYYLRKQKYTINTQGVVGYNLLFLDIATGYLGSLHDARILRSSALYLKAESGDILSRPAKVVDGYCIRFLILTHSAYPSTTWQVEPYNFNVNLTESQKAFNKQLSAARVTVEKSFWGS